MAKKTSRIELTDDEISRRLPGMPEKINRYLKGVTEYVATQGEAYMKRNAPWTDQTSNARNTLGAKAFHEDYTHTVVLYGGMPYQIYLETIQEGKFAIITPSINVMGRVGMALCSDLLSRLDGS